MDSGTRLQTTKPGRLPWRIAWTESAGQAAGIKLGELPRGESSVKDRYCLVSLTSEIFKKKNKTKQKQKKRVENWLPVAGRVGEIGRSW